MKFKNVMELKVWASLEMMGQVLMIEHKEVVSKIKKDNPKVISINCYKHKLALAIPFSLKKSIFLMEKKKK